MLTTSLSVDMFMPKPNFEELEPIDERLIQTSDLRLPHIIKDHVPRITCDQLAQIIKTPTLFSFDLVMILDARFPYEFKGGHIMTARNILNRSQLRKIFRHCSNKNYCVICHCEFSQKRGPSLFQMIRSFDRESNQYPHLSIPEMYVLDGGYKQFYEKYPSLCVGGYTEMRDDHFVSCGELRRCHSFYKRQMERPHSTCSLSPISLIPSSIHSSEDEEDLTETIGRRLKRSNSTKGFLSQNLSFSMSDNNFSLFFPTTSSQPDPII